MFLLPTTGLAIHPVNTDLTDYVTRKTLDGLFYHIGLKNRNPKRSGGKGYGYFKESFCWSEWIVFIL